MALDIPAMRKVMEWQAERRFIELVDKHWWNIMQGESGAAYPEDEPNDVRDLILHMRRQIRSELDAMGPNFATTPGDGIEQHDRDGNLLTEISEEELARRVCEAYLLLYLGGRWS